MKSTAQYIIRLDDANPWMDHKKWGKIETMLDNYSIKPIVAIIPDCDDTTLMIDSLDKNFWDKVSRWKDKEWTMALHGYNHVYITNRSGLVPINKKSEFASLPIEKQLEKISVGYGIFLKNKIIPKVFVAPAHSFDTNTLKAIAQKTDIKVISDGLAIKPYTFLGFEWIPQQLWKFRKMPFGTWTICLHPNTMTDTDFNKLEHDLNIFSNRFISFENIIWRRNNRDFLDRIFAFCFFCREKLYRLKQLL
jgi:predicted deacetylase